MFRIILALCLIVPSIAGAATSVTKDSITWNFNADYTVGQFVTGDWYVVAPSGLTVTSITETSSYALGGSMKNPNPALKKQGYFDNGTDTNKAAYDATLNVGSSSISLVAGDMLISTTIYPYYGVVYDGEKNYTMIDEAAILTVLSAAPAYGADSFRPGICDTTRTVYNSANIDYDQLADVTPASGAPSLSAVEELFARPWIDHYAGPPGRSIHPHNNMRDYGGEISVDIGNAALLVNTNLTNAQKKPLTVGLIQMGIDTYSMVTRNRRLFDISPAHTVGRKFPVLFAANVMNITAFKSFIQRTGQYMTATWGVLPSDAYVFDEDYTSYVRSEDVSVTATGTAQYLPDYNYTSAMIGMPEWFHHDFTNRAKSNAAWTPDPYRFLSSSTYYGAATATILMGARSQWNNQAYFDYISRLAAITRGSADPNGFTVPLEASGNSTAYGSNWGLAMWDLYSDSVTGNTPPSRTNLGPTSLLASGTTTATLTVDATDAEGSVAGCKANTTDVAYASMSITMTGSLGTYTYGLTGLTDGSSYNYYVRCIDDEGLANTTSSLISFSVDEAVVDQVCDANHYWLCETDETCVGAGHSYYDSFCHSATLPSNVVGGNLLTNPTLTWAGATLTGWDLPYSGVTAISGGGAKLTAGVAWPPAAIRQRIGSIGDGKTYIVVADVSASTDQLELYTTAEGIQYFYGLPRTVITEFTTNGDNWMYVQTHHTAVRYNDVLHVGVYEVRNRPAGSNVGMGFSGVTIQ